MNMNTLYKIHEMKEAEKHIISASIINLKVLDEMKEDE